LSYPQWAQCTYMVSSIW